MAGDNLGLLGNGVEAIRERRFPAALPLAGTLGLAGRLGDAPFLR